MGMELLTFDWTAESSKHDKAAVEAAITAITDEWLDDNYDHLQMYGSADDYDEMRDYLRRGAADYDWHLAGTHRYGTSRPVGIGLTQWIYTAGGSSWGDDPYDDWSALASFIEACNRLPDLAAAAGFVPFDAPAPATFDLSRIDYDMLRGQKAHLAYVIRDLEMAGGDDSMDQADALTGILHLLDAIQDQAAEAGQPVIWLSEDED